MIRQENNKLFTPRHFVSSSLTVRIADQEEEKCEEKQKWKREKRGVTRNESVTSPFAESISLSLSLCPLPRLQL